MFFEIGSLKNLVIFTGKHLSWGLFLIKLQTFRLAIFFKRDSNICVSCGYCEIFKNSFFYRTPPVAASDSPTTVQQSQLGCLFFDFPPQRAFDFDQKLTQNIVQIIIYYHVRKQFPCLNWFITCFWFHMFWKNNYFRFWWKTYTKCCPNHYVTSIEFHLGSWQLPTVLLRQTVFF